MHGAQTKPAGVFRKTAESFYAGANTLPQKYFISSNVFAEEQDKIFSKHWMLVGHHSEIPQAGDYLVAKVAGENLIIVRDKSGEIHAFHNLCRHRGRRLIEERNG